MRDVKPSITDSWNRLDFIGDRRNIVRVTVQHPNIKLVDVGYNLYASLPFGATEQPKELPNVKVLSWDRDAAADVASATLDFYNTEPLPVGTAAVQDPYVLDQPGYFTFRHGQTTFSKRWGHAANEWSGLIVPDNVIRTYEGYGCDPLVCPEHDTHLEQTGTWMIDKVAYRTDGLISVTMRDIGRVLSDQLIFPPVTPKAYYPPLYTTDHLEPGFIAGKTFTKVVTTGGDYDPKHPPPAMWTGPTAAPTIDGLVDGVEGFSVRIGAPAVPAAGYSIVGYQLVIDNVRLPKLYQVPRDGSPEARTVVLGRLTNANVYLVNAVAIYERGSDKVRLASNRSTDLFARPRSGGGPDIVFQSILRDTDADGNQNLGETHPGQLVWQYRGTGNAVDWRVVFYRTKNFPGFERTVEYFTSPATADGSAQTAVFQTTKGAPLDTLSDWNILIYGVAVRTGDNMQVVGAGDAAFKPVGGEFYRPPTIGGPPQQVGGVSTQSGTKLPGNVTVRPTLDASSNDFYTRGEVFGHLPAHAFDADAGTYFLSVGNGSAAKAYAFEWIQGALGGQTLVGVRFSTAKAGYTAFVSVYAHGQWVSFNDEVIPYNPELPESHNGGNIPYVGTVACQTEGPHQLILSQPIPGATKIRLTLRNLQDFGLGEFRYRGGVRELTVLASTTAGVASGPIQDGAAPTTASTYTVNEPAHVQPGIGQRPGKYSDYTDLVKLFCAWGGFFWPQDGAQLTSCGTVERYSFGPGPFGLPAAVDPVLGEAAGRVWGDFEQTGTAGVADLLANNFEKKSLLEGIAYVREIIGFLFYIDELGSCVWRRPNIFKLGNDVATLTQQPRRTDEIPVLDENHVILDLTATLDSKNVRERVFVASTDGRAASLAQGYNPNPIGLRRVGGWTDQNFATQAEAALMADFIALRQLMSYRTNSLLVPGYPKIQVNDQVQIFERITNEGYVHSVTSIHSENNMEDGEWTYRLGTVWLGESPFTTWLFHPDGLTAETQQYLTDLGLLPPPPAGAPLAGGGVATGAATQLEDKVQRYVRVDGNPQVYLTDGIFKRPITDETERIFYGNIGLVTTVKVQIIPQVLLDRLIVATG